MPKSEVEEPRARKRKIAAALQLVGSGSSAAGSGAASSSSYAASAAMPHMWSSDSARRVDVDIAKTLQAIVDHQLAGLRRAKKIDDAWARAAIDRLRASKCAPEDIARQVAEELSRALSQRSDAPNHISLRLGGFGWSAQHIEEHMKRFLEGRIAQMTACLRSDAAPVEAQRESWLSVLEEAEKQAQAFKL
jgi:hypothetical protein